MELKQLGLRLWDSKTNFLLAQPPKGNAEQIHMTLKERAILMHRCFKQPSLADKLRITVSTDEQNQMLVEALVHLV